VGASSACLIPSRWRRWGAPAGKCAQPTAIRCGARPRWGAWD